MVASPTGLIESKDGSVMEFKGFMLEMIRSELEDAVGQENVSSKSAGKLAHGVDYF